MHLVKINNEIFNLDQILHAKYDENHQGGPALYIKGEHSSPDAPVFYVYDETATILWEYLCTQLEDTKTPLYINKEQHYDKRELQATSG